MNTAPCHSPGMGSFAGGLSRGFLWPWAPTIVALIALVQGCGSTEPRPKTPASRVQESDPRAMAVALGHGLLSSLQHNNMEDLWIPDGDLRRSLTDEMATQLSARRDPARIPWNETTRLAWSRFELQRLCLQGYHREPAGTHRGLRENTWVLDRILLVGSLSGQQPAGGWVEGWFLESQGQLRAVSVLSVQTPRFRHADLELARCDMSLEVNNHNM